MAVIELRTTREAAKELHITEARLLDLVRRGKIAEPARIGTRFAWTPEDITAAAIIVRRNK